MRRVLKWLVGGLVALALLLGGVALALQHWVGSADFRQRVAQQVSAAVGVPVELGQITVDVWPVPAVALDRVQVRTKPAVTLERIEARPRWAPLLRGRLEIATLVVRRAVLPEQAIAVLLAGTQKQRGAAGAPAPAAAPAAWPRRAVLDGVTWVAAGGGSTTIDAQLRMDDDGLPGEARVAVRQGKFQGAKAALERADGGWTLQAQIGGGTVKGQVRQQPGPAGAISLQAQLDTNAVEVAALTAPSRTLTGRLDAHTSLRATVGGGVGFVDSLQSQTRLSVRNAVVHGVDLAQAVKTIGLSRGGQTALDTLAGQVVSQGRSLQLNNLVATSGAMSMTGTVAMAPNRSLSGRLSVDLAAAAAGGAIGVPLAVGGTLDAPSVTLTRGALLGAAIGTAIAPGVGTGAGAKLGDRLGEGLRSLFGK
ncbi:AsmA family protein [Ramlibacter sp.]|uniref:AsmA family protein n=1 Tax=Ramlibacter sp. TaxID=1917967 RepID=UPI002D01F309|nr:AsmA family protein [Ramlibacter sp.]HWI83527.1 AsmA family protein [Ramlibacter sp.]